MENRLRHGNIQTVTIIGQGYVGLPVAHAATSAGLKVFGYEISPERAESLSAGLSHVDDITDEDLENMLARGYKATTDASVIGQSDVVVICVPTPLDSNGGPDLRAVQSASHTIGQHLRSGTTVILESTTYPGTTDDIVLPILTETSGLMHVPESSFREGFYLAFSPERIDPGSKNWTVFNTPKLVGGVTPEASGRAGDFYKHFVDRVIPLSGTREAETAKLLENTYRHVNIALVNEMARFCHDLNIDIWEVIRGAATKPFGFQKFTPGPGVGGHCIPIDPNYLSYQVKKTLGYQFRFVELAQEINNSMPSYVVERVGDLLNDNGLPLNGAKILLLGITYKPDIADQRESPALPIARIFQEKKSDVRFHDPLIQEWNLPSGVLFREPELDSAVAEADIAILLQGHTAYDVSSLASASKLFFDTRGGMRDSHDGSYHL